MRNLKRALSLTLASVMLLGMMVVGSSAAGFPDVTEEDNVEAIEVLKAVEVMIGDDHGNFGPNDPVNRSQMAVVMANLLNLDYQYYESSCIFWDVPTWARGYVGACYAKGIVSGYGGTTYGAADTVTAVQAASMMMRALGYFQNPEDYKGSFELATVSQGTDIGIFDGVGSSATAPMTRNQVARMALNALRSEMVTFTGTPGITVGDVTVGYRAEYTPRTSTEAKYNAIEGRTSDVASDLNHKGQYYVQLGEELYNGKLKLRDSVDVFGRPSRRWEFDGKEIGTYAKKELLDKEYVGKVTGKDLYDELGSENLDEYALTVTVDGVSDPKIADEVKLDPNRNTSIVFNRADLNRNNKAAVGATGTGVQTEVYVDHENDRIYIAVINTYLAIADKDYDEKKEEVPLSVYGVKAAPTSKEYVKLKGNDVTIKLGIEDFDMVTDIAKNDSFLVTLADQEIQTIVPAEVLSGSTISAFKLDDHVVSGGTSYNYTTTATYDAGSLKIYTGDMSTNLKDRTYDIYLDAYGNLIGLKEIEATKNYVFITGLDRNSSNMSNKIADANAIFLDGTSDVIQVNMNKSVWHTDFNNQNAEGEALLNTWCTYTKSGDLYTVKEVISAGDSVKNLYNNVPGVTPDGNDEFGKGNSTGLAQFHQTGKTAANNTDDEFTIDLKRLRLEGGGKSDSAFKYVYGDSDSVYMTAELGELRSGDTEGSYGIIKDASTVATGIIDTSITVWNAQGAMDAANAENDVKAQEVTKSARVSKGVYTLYDDDGTIIAVMAVGEGSAAKDLVYVHTSVIDLESDNGGSNGKAADDGLWTWTRRVIRDGEEVTLTEVGDSAEYINATDMLQYHWYEVRTDGEGNVIKASEAEIALGDTGRDRFVTDYTKINDVVEEDGVDTVLFQSNGGPISGKNFTNGYATDLLVKGNNTLAVDTQKGSGIHFRNDVNVVLQYWNRNTQEIDIMAGEGVDDLKDMVAIVNDNNDYNDRGDNTYYLSALIENGLATEIVIFDSYNTYRNGWTGEGNVTISFEYADYPITRYDFTVNGGDPLTSDDFTVSRGVWSLNVKTNDRLDITLKTATTENFGKQGDRVVVSARNEDHNYLTGTIRSQGYSVRIVPEVAGAYVLLDTFKAVTTEYFTVDVGANVTVTANGKDYTDQTVELEEGTELKIVAGEGYTATVNGKPLNATGKYTLTGNMKIVATKNGEDPKPGDPVKFEVTFSNEAEWNLLKPSGEILDKENVKPGDSFTLDPAYVLTVKEGATYDEASKTWTVDEGASTVTLTTKNGGRWMLGMWWGTAPDGKNRPLIDFVDKLSLTRGAYPNWYVLAKEGETFEIRINMGDDVQPVVLFISADENGIFFEFSGENAEDADYDKAFDRLGEEDNYEMKPVEGEEPDDDTYTLNLTRLLGSSADQGNTKVRTLGKDGKWLDATITRDGQWVYASYEIAAGATVSVESKDFSCFDSTGFGAGKYLVDGVEMTAAWDALGQGPLSFTFPMPDHDVTMELQEKNKFDGDKVEKVVKVKSEGGVTVKFEGTAGGKTVVKTLEADQEMYLTAGVNWKVTVTDMGAGSAVRDTVSGTDWTKDTAVTGYTLHGDATFYSGYKVASFGQVNIKYDGQVKDLAGGQIAVIPAGKEIQVYYYKNYSDTESGVKVDPDEAAILALTPDNWVFHAEDGASNLLCGRVGHEDTYTVNSDTTFCLAAEFTLEEGVTAAYTADGKSHNLTSGTWYMKGGVDYTIPEVQQGKQDGEVKGEFALTFVDPDKTGVVNRAMIGNEADIIMGITNGTGAIENAEKVATAAYVVEANPWNGDVFESWTVVKTDGIDEGYLDNGRRTRQIFDDAYAIDEANDNNAQEDTIKGHSAKFGRVAKTFFLDPNMDEETLVVYGASGKDRETYKITLNGADGVAEWTEPFNGKTAWAAFNKVPGGTVELKAVEK